MINGLIKVAYKILPKSLIKKVGSSKVIEPIRNLFLRTGNRSRLIEVNVKWDGLFFTYKGDIKSAIKAEKKDIESSLLRLSNSLLKEIKHRNEDANILDIGSSYGFLSTVWALTSAKRGIVYAFEASKDVFVEANNTASKNKLQANLKYYNKAVYNHDGYIFVNRHDGTHASLSENETISTIKFPCTTIDSFILEENINRIDLIKIDVDGPEFEVLEGATKLLQRDKPIVIVETNGNKEIANYLLELGYSLFDMNKNPFHNEDSLPPNLLAIG